MDDIRWMTSDKTTVDGMRSVGWYLSGPIGVAMSPQRLRYSRVLPVS